MSEWISVEDYLPAMAMEEDGDPVEVSNKLLVVVDGRVCFGSCYRGVKTGRTKFQAEGHLGDFTVTHWMPLPNPPSPKQHKDGE